VHDPADRPGKPSCGDRHRKLASEAKRADRPGGSLQRLAQMRCVLPETPDSTRECRDRNPTVETRDSLELGRQLDYLKRAHERAERLSERPFGGDDRIHFDPELSRSPEKLEVEEFAPSQEARTEDDRQPVQDSFVPNRWAACSNSTQNRSAFPAMTVGSLRSLAGKLMAPTRSFVMTSQPHRDASITVRPIGSCH
jgi:hypothetical protein